MNTTGDAGHHSVPPIDFDQMEVVGNQLFSVAVPIEADPEFKAYVLAAGVAHSLGRRSIDHVLRKHGEEWVKKLDRDAHARSGANSLRLEIRQYATARCAAISALDLTQCRSAGLIAAANAQIRLESTFRAALQLTHAGYAFEAEAVIRLGLEQVAWTYGVHRLEGLESVVATSGTGWMTRLKEVFPGAGRVYSQLSDFAHVAPRTHERFVQRSEEGTLVRIKSPASAQESLLLLLALLDAFLVISEVCLGAFGLECENVDLVRVSPLQSRIAMQIAVRHSNALPVNAATMIGEWARRT